MKPQHIQCISECWSIPGTVETSEAYYLQPHMAAPPDYSTKTRATRIADAMIFCFISLWPTGAVSVHTKVYQTLHVHTRLISSALEVVLRHQSNTLNFEAFLVGYCGKH